MMEVGKRTTLCYYNTDLIYNVHVLSERPHFIVSRVAKTCHNSLIWSNERKKNGECEEICTDEQRWRTLGS